MASRPSEEALTVIADINWVVFYSLIALGVTLTAVFTYFVATWGQPTGRRPELTSGGRGAASHEATQTAAGESQRRAA